MKAHLKRWITGLVVVPILFALIAYGSEGLFFLLILLATLTGLYEYQRLAVPDGDRGAAVLMALAAVLMLLAAADKNLTGLLAVTAFSVMLLLVLQLPLARRGQASLNRVGRMALGLLYIPLLMSYWILIRQGENGRTWIFFILVLAFAGDIAAFYVGRRFGKRKLLPEVSPGKSVEGVFGLCVGSLAGGLLFRAIFLPELPIIHAAVLALVGSLLGQLGDLCESLFKREAGVKDSGVLLPGHGGILDRLDCLIFIAPYVYYYQVMVLR